MEEEEEEERRKRGRDFVDESYTVGVFSPVYLKKNFQGLRPRTPGGHPELGGSGRRELPRKN